MFCPLGYGFSKKDHESIASARSIRGFFFIAVRDLQVSRPFKTESITRDANWKAKGPSPRIGISVSAM